MTAAVYVGYALAIAGLLGAGIGISQMARRNVQHVGANNVFVKLLAAGNVDRALKLCRVGNETTYMRAIEAAIVAGAAGPMDRALLARTMEHAFDQAGTARAAAWRRAMLLGALASVVSLVGATIVVVSAGVGKHAPSTGAIAIGAIAAFAGIGCATRFKNFDKALAGARTRLLPLLADAFLNGATVVVNPDHAIATVLVG